MPPPDRGSSPVPATAVAGVATALLLLGLVLIGVRAATPTDGVFVNIGESLWQDGRLSIQWPTPSHLPRGAEILAIEGRSPTGWAAEGAWSGRLLGADPADGQVTYTIRESTGEVRDVAVPLRRYPVTRMLATNWAAVAWVVLLAIVGGYLLRRRPRALVAQLVAWCAALQAVAAVAWVFGFAGYDLTSPLRLGSWILSGIAYQLLWACGVHFALVFPVRHPLAARHRWLIPAVYLALPAVRGLDAAARVGWGDGDWRWVAAALTPGLVEQVVPPVLLVAFLLLNYRACTDPALRAQLRLVGLATGAAVAAFACLVIVPIAVTGGPWLAGPLQPLLFLPVSITIAAAVLRHQMLDITMVVNRSATGLAMTAAVVGGYVAVVSVLSLMFDQWFHPVAAVVGSGMVALAFQPVRQRVQALVNRWTYGEREPHRLAGRLARQIERAQAPESALSEAVRVISAQLRLSTVAIELPDGSRLASYGTGPGTGPGTAPGAADGRFEVVPLTYQSDPVARLLVGWPPGRPPSHLDRELLVHLAPQLGTAVHVARLTADVRRSREQIVLAREEERRRIYRDLHDGTAASLAATALHLQIAQASLAPEQGDLKATLGRLIAETQSAAEGVRRLMDNLSPPVLHELGLVKALHEKALTFSGRLGGDHAGPLIAVHAGDLPTLSTGIQVALFRIAVESMVNVVRHARARRCTVRLTYDGALHLRIRDDGVGLPVPFEPGVGVRSMRERAAELGGSCAIRPAPDGGTEVVVVLPVHPCPLPPSQAGVGTASAGSHG